MKNGAGPTVLVRTDLDALPVEEETGLPYASKVVTKNDEGKEVHVMHACGHDIHMSTFIGMARALSETERPMARHDSVCRTTGGRNGRRRARDVEGWPLHTLAETGFRARLSRQCSDVAAGHIGVTEGYTYANVDSVDVTVRGVGGHGAYPHKTKDPVVLSAEIINAWQTIASRENNPLDPIVVTVGSIHGGTKHNIISNEVKMQLTVRTYKAEVRERVLAAIERIAKGCAIAAGLPQDKMPMSMCRRTSSRPRRITIRS